MRSQRILLARNLAISSRMNKNDDSKIDQIARMQRFNKNGQPHDSWSRNSYQFFYATLEGSLKIYLLFLLLSPPPRPSARYSNNKIKNTFFFSYSMWTVDLNLIEAGMRNYWETLISNSYVTSETGGKDTMEQQRSQIPKVTAASQWHIVCRRHCV